MNWWTWRPQRVVMFGLAAIGLVAACAGSAATPSAPGPTTPVASGPAVSGPTGTAAAQLEDKVVIQTSGGVFEQSMIKLFYGPFTKETGVEVVPVGGNVGETNAKLRADLAAGTVEYDIVTQIPPTGFDPTEFLTNIDCSKLDLSQSVEGTCTGDTLVLRTLQGEVVAWDTSAFPNGGPQTFADFFDLQKFPGARTMNNSGTFQRTIAIALLADGVSRADVETKPWDLDRAFRKLDTIRSEIKVWWKSGDQQQQIFRDDEVDLGIMWVGRALALRGDPFPLAFSWDNAIKDPGYWAVPKGAPHPNAAYAFLNYYLTHPEASLGLSVEGGYGTSNAEATSRIPENRKADFASTYWDSMVDVEHNPWYTENYSMIQERYNAWSSQ